MNEPYCLVSLNGNASNDFEGYLYQGCQNRNFTSGRKRIEKSAIVKSQPKSKDFTQLLQ